MTQPRGHYYDISDNIQMGGEMHRTVYPVSEHAVRTFSENSNEIAKRNQLDERFEDSGAAVSFFYAERLDGASSDSSVVFKPRHGNTPKHFEYSFDGLGGWIPITVSDEIVRVAMKAGFERMYIRGCNDTLNVFPEETDNGMAILFDFDCAVGGDITTLLDMRGGLRCVPSFAFYGLFAGCERLVDASELVIDVAMAGDYAFGGMFNGAVSMSTGPRRVSCRIPREGTMAAMFGECRILTESPNIYIPKVMTRGLVRDMFSNCGALRKVTVSHPNGLIWDSQASQGWLDNVDTSGVIYGLSGVGGVPSNSGNGCPVGWTVAPPNQ